jgi:hypothetical protein
VERPSRSSAAPGPTYDRPSIPQQPRKRRGGWGIWLLAAGLGLGAYALIATGTLDSLRQPAAPAPAPAVGGTIDVTVSPSDAQIFVFIGRGPAAADGLPIDAAHEFVVFDEGLEPSRAIVAKGATWATTDSGPLYELAVQARPASTAASSGDLGAPQTAPTSASDRASGTIRVITNPPAAKVYRFVGLGPTVRIPVASIHEGQELLVFRAGHETRRAVIGPSDWQKAPGSAEHGASLTIKLPALPGSASAETIED